MNNLKIASFRVLQACKQLGSCRSGNVAMIFGLTLVPLIAIAGIAVEYSGASSVRVKLQAATDAASLAGASVSPWSDEACRARALDVFNDRITGQSWKSEGPPEITCSASWITIDASAEMATSLMSVAGIKSVALAASSQTTCGMQAEASASSSPIAWQQPWLPDRTRVVTLGTHISGVVYYWRTVDGNPIVRLDNPHEGPATIVIRSVPAAPDGNMSFDVPERGQFFVVLPFVPASQITLFVDAGPLPKSGGSATWNNNNNREFTEAQIHGTPIYPGELVRRCWISQ